MLTLYTSTPVEKKKKTKWGKSECVIIPEEWQGLSHTTNKAQLLTNAGAVKHPIGAIALGLTFAFSIGMFGTAATEQARCLTFNQRV
jgi:hypothetical protein